MKDEDVHALQGIQYGKYALKDDVVEQDHKNARGPRLTQHVAEIYDQTVNL